ncbi:unnamed protein product [Lymnaea stagnalis]|uniref:Uncharacterized protein n=1 Tax=Lymnaea stagnalis TaxID=6523 RepID=A0AAV2IF58_LYMST
MVEVTRHNFDAFLPQIEYSINSADFIAVDTEFTGLYFDETSKPSLFDNTAERYAKIKTSVQKFTLSQIGFTTFTGNVEENSYSAQTFQFHLCPEPSGSIDQRFTVQASCIKFLCKHSFNYNKWLYEGLPYLNLAQEKLIKEELAAGLMLESDIYEKDVQTLCSKVASWLASAEIGECLTLSLNNDVDLSSYVYHSNLRSRFAQIWTTTNQFDQIVVERIDEMKRQLLEKQSADSDQVFQKMQIEEMLGFTRVFRLIQEAKKPLVGHNLLMDLMFMYEKFHNYLPDSFNVFKEDIQRMFPVIFDTKHINHCLRKVLESVEVYSVSSLKDLYDGIKSILVHRTLGHPSIIQDESVENKETDQLHHAGYDSYLCGYVFLRLCHFLHFRDVCSMDVRPCAFKDYLGTMKKYKNCINLIRAMAAHIKLDGEEPPSQRPPLIFVNTVKPGAKLISQQLAVWFSLYGLVDIQMINSRQAIVATSNFLTAREILEAFKNHHSIAVTKYRFWEHSRLGQSILWVSLAVTTGSCAYLLFNTFR